MTPTKLTLFDAALSEAAGHQVELRGASGGTHWLVLPVDRTKRAEPLWRVIRAEAPVHTWKTVEAAVVGFAAGLHAWKRQAGRMAVVNVDAELRALLKGHSFAVTALRNSFAAQHVSHVQLESAAKRLGVIRTKVGFRGGWKWSLPKTELSPSAEAAKTEIGLLFNDVSKG